MPFYDADVFNKELRCAAHAKAAYSSDKAVICTIYGFGHKSVKKEETSLAFSCSFGVSFECNYKDSPSRSGQG